MVLRMMPKGIWQISEYATHTNDTVVVFDRIDCIFGRLHKRFRMAMPIVMN